MIRTLPALLLVLLTLACGDKDPPAKASLPATFCADGNKLCVGNVVATCSQAGTAYAIAACSESQYCAAATCQAISCEKAALTCDGSKKNQMKCPDDGSADPGLKQPCPNGCMNGACLPKTCKDNDVMCGWRGVLTCKNNAWTFGKCASDELCDATAHCAKRACTPDAVQCKSATVAQRCSVVGDKWLDQPCGDGNGCFDGVCHTIVASSVAVDAGSTSDSGPAEDISSATDGKDGHSFADTGKKDVQLEQNDILKFVVSETAKPGSTPPVELDLASVTWNDGLKMLQISGTQGLNKFELQLAKIEEFQTGDFSATGGEAPDTVLYFNDGTTVDPKVQWKYASTDYEVHLETFGDAGDRVIGSFSAVMADAENPGKKIYFIDGVFDIGRK